MMTSKRDGAEVELELEERIDVRIFDSCSNITISIFDLKFYRYERFISVGRADSQLLPACSFLFYLFLFTVIRTAEHKLSSRNCLVSTMKGAKTHICRMFRESMNVTRETKSHFKGFFASHSKMMFEYCPENSIDSFHKLVLFQAIIGKVNSRKESSRMLAECMIFHH